MPKHRYFVHFHLQMCFALQRREIFRHQTSKKCSEHHMFCTFSLQNVCFATAAYIFSTSHLQKVLRTPHVLYIFTSNVRFATAACNFSTSHLQKMLRTPHVLHIFTSNRAFCHSGVQFFDFSSEHLGTRRFNRPTFQLTRHTNH